MKDNLEKAINELRNEVAELRERCAQLELRMNEPPTQPQWVNNRCSDCGLDLSKPLGYVCPRMGCKHFIQITCSSSN